MLFTLIADTHNQHNNLSIAETDFLVIAGDYSSKNSKMNLINFAEWLKKQPAKYKILINGNHDRYYYRHPEEFKQIIGNDVIFLENNDVIIENIKIWGSSLTVPVVEGIYNQVQKNEDDRAAICKTIPNDTDIIITHSPPFGILDEVKKDEHLGCKALRKRIFEIKPKYHLFGHIHQAYGEIEVNGICFKNGTLVNDNEVIVREPIVFRY